MSDRTFISRKVTRMLRQLLWVVFAFILVTACRADHSQVSPMRSLDAIQIAPSDSVRLVQHMMGETQVPANPQRVVTLDGNYLYNALVLRIQPIGSVAWFNAAHRRAGFATIEPYLRDRAQEVTILGYDGKADLEKVLLLKPDLILGTNTHEAIYEQLSQIAPTVLCDYSVDNFSWEDIMRFSGDVFGKSQNAEKLLDDYYQRTQELRQKLRQERGKPVSTIQVSAIRPMSNGARLITKTALGGSVMEDVGLSRPPEQDRDGFTQTISYEWIPHMDGDVIFVISYYMDEDSVEQVNQLKNQPLWSQLEAVQQGKVYPVNGLHWYGGNIVRANLVLDDLFKYLLEEE